MALSLPSAPVLLGLEAARIPVERPRMSRAASGCTDRVSSVLGALPSPESSGCEIQSRDNQMD